jgi:hypothetical protein
MTMDIHNPQTGHFLPGRSGNPKGRPKKVHSVDTAVLNAINEKVTVHENGRRRRVSKVDVAAKQLVNKSAGGDLRATKMALDYAQKAEERAGETASRNPAMTISDQEIAARVIERLTRLILAGQVTVPAKMNDASIDTNSQTTVMTDLQTGEANHGNT